MTSTGPSIRAVCRIINSNSCGSGSICGIQPNGHALILTNAHVAGTAIGRVVKVFVESTGDNIRARVIQAAYSDRTISDWAVLETTEPYQKIAPVYLSKKKPSGSHYTKGFPRCQPHSGTDIRTVDFGSNGVWFWEPDAIGGQSGSGVWSDIDNFQYGLLTWEWNNHGAGQQTAEIYRQARTRSTAGYPRPPGLTELNDWDWTGIEKEGLDDPIFENAFVSQTSITTLPIWAEDQVEPLPPPDDRPEAFTSLHWVEYCREVEELHERWRLKFESTGAPGTGNGTGVGGPDFGL